MNEQAVTPGKDPETAGEARHGYRNEVNWEGGSGRRGETGLGQRKLTGRQPYGNQGEEETPSPAAADEVPEGNRGERSGENLDQLDRVKRKP